MSRTVDLACTGSAWCPKTSPDTNYHGASIYELAGTNAYLYYTYLLLKFADLQEADKYYDIYSVRYIVPCEKNIPTSTVSVNAYVEALKDTFDETTVTYNNMPRKVTDWSGGATIRAGTGADTIEYFPTTSTDVKTATEEALATRAAAVYVPKTLSGSNYLRAYTEQAASANRPVLRVTLSDTVASVETTLTAPENLETFDCTQAMTFSWAIDFVSVGASANPLADIVQTSATFYWREVGDEEWNELQASGDVRSITVPANTFPARDIQWRVVPVVVNYTMTGVSGYRLAHPRRIVDMLPTSLAGVWNLYPDETIPWTGSFNVSTSDWSIGTDHYRCLLAMFAEFPEEYKYHAVMKAGFSCVSMVDANEITSVNLYLLESGFDERIVTWNTKPEATGGNVGVYIYDNSGSDSYKQIRPFIAVTQNASGVSYSDTRSQSEYAVDSLKASALMLKANARMNNPDMGLKSGKFWVSEPVARRAYLIDLILTSMPQAVTPASGYVNPHVEQIFSWELIPDGDYWCYGGWEQASATFSFRQGTSGPWDTIAVSGSDQFVMLAPDTLEAGTVQWKVETTDTDGTTAESEIYTISTTDSATTATPIVPKETLENGDAPIRFIWEVANDHNTEPTGADLQMSNNGSSWSTLAQITTGATQYDAPAGTFSTGTRYWRVRAYNADGVAGAWSDPVTFVVVAAPPAPVVSADGKPYATITWQSSGQMAYRVTVDGKLYGPYFGTAKSFETPDFLSDGSHTAEVSVQGEAGLWSQPGSVTFSVTNIPGDPVSLTGKYGRDAALRWSTEATVANFYVYRDGIRIGHTAAKQFTDRFVLGAHEYFIINKLPGGYYTRSNLSSGTMRSCTRAVAAFSGSGWLEMALSDESDTTEEFAWNQVVSERYVTGSDLPVVETSPYRSGSGSYRISFKDAQTGAAFEALRGQKVIVKSRGGNVAIGVLSGYTKTMGNFYINYTFSVRSCSWEDYVDETGD